MGIVECLPVRGLLPNTNGMDNWGAPGGTTFYFNARSSRSQMKPAPPSSPVKKPAPPASKPSPPKPPYIKTVAEPLLTAPPGRKKRKKLKPSERRTKLRDRLWPGSDCQTWHRLQNDGYITIPKLLSLICALLKELADNDPTRVYLDLWCRSYDEGIIESIDEDEAAFSSGYVGTRAKRTWTDHMYQLEKLGFIKIAKEGNSAIGHVLLLNPLYVVEELRHKHNSKMQPEWWHAYLARASVIGAVLPSDDDEDEST